MKGRCGSALVLVMIITAVLSLFMLRMYARSSLLLRSVIEREHDISLRYATEALMQYAVCVAKHNLAYLTQYTAKEVSEHMFQWEINEKRKGNAICMFKKDSKGIFIEVSLEEGTRLSKISCVVMRVKGRVAGGKGESVIIDEWKTE